MPWKPILPRPIGCICLDPHCSVPWGLCHCGCKRKTSIAPETSLKHHQYKDFPKMFLSGHSVRHPRIDQSILGHFKIEGVYCRLIALSRGLFSIVDESDYEWLSAYTWTAQYSKLANGHYALRRQWDEESKKFLRITMHGSILGVKGGDHSDPWNTLDNRRKNLRPCDRSENAMNRRVRSDNTSGRKGVIPIPYGFLAYITVKGKMFRKSCKTFEEACKEREEMEKKYHGEFARAA